MQHGEARENEAGDGGVAMGRINKYEPIMLCNKPLFVEEETSTLHTNISPSHVFRQKKSVPDILHAHTKCRDEQS